VVVGPSLDVPVVDAPCAGDDRTFGGQLGRLGETEVLEQAGERVVRRGEASLLPCGGGEICCDCGLGRDGDGAGAAEPAEVAVVRADEHDGAA
jgi:hypothetical protein